MELRKVTGCLLLLGTMLVGTAQAQRTQYGSWTTGLVSEGDGLYAATVNDSGHVLGQYCFPSSGNCFYVLGLDTSCKKDNSYPVLINSDAGSLKLDLVCDGALDSGKYRYLLNPFDDIDDIVKKANRLGIAIPLRGDQFTVIRFNLNGSNESIAAMRAAASQALDATRPARRSTRDQRL